ncbi:hypothetical protein HY990_06545 [Candidatus Micrarchaeota archaeon]|nr:hypothetical protein [Candidatus Micrarchaeota archaeon]
MDSKPSRFPSSRVIFFSLLLLCGILAATDIVGLFDDVRNTVDSGAQDFLTATGSTVGGVGSTARSGYTAILSAFEPATCSASVSANASSLGLIAISQWIAPAMLVMVIVLIGIAFLYMISQFFNSPSMATLAKDELFQMGLTIIRLVFIIGPLILANGWLAFRASPVGPGPGSDYAVYVDQTTLQPRLMIDASMAVARSMVNDMTKHYSMLLLYNNVIHTIYSATLSFGVSWRAMYTFNLGPILRPFIDVLSMTLQALSLGLGEWLLHIITLCMIKQYMFTLFLPVGILLRSFPYTRGAGEAFLSLGFALIVFYPFTFVLDYEAHRIMRLNLSDPSASLRSLVSSGGLASVSASLLVAMFVTGGVFIPFFLGGALNVAFDLVRGAVYYIVIMSLMLPVVNIFLTLTVAREMARFFRNDINFLSFLKII